MFEQIDKWFNRLKLLKKSSSPLGKLREEILHYYKHQHKEPLSQEEHQVLNFLKSYKPAVFPYSFTRKYKASDIEVLKDESKGLHYVIDQGKKLYFKRSWHPETVRKNYNFLRMEQDPDSPHRYLTSSFDVNENDVVADIGVAEGNFALSIIEKVQQLFVFERDVEWIEALNATFEPWRDKIHIVHKFVSDKNDEQFVTLDRFFEGRKLDFLKIDVDGAERELLSGAEKLLSSGDPLKIAICTYHNQGDHTEFGKLLESKNFRIEFSKGFMIFIHDTNPKSPPYFRRGLIRAER